jgi:maleylacetate reductase
MYTAVRSGVHRSLPLERIVYGRPAAEVIAEEAGRLGKRRVFVTTSRSLSSTDALPARIAAALGSSYAGRFFEISAHSPRACVLAGAAAARAAGADLLVAVGGGSVVDATKAMLMCLWQNVETEAALGELMGQRSADPSRPLPDAAAKTRMLAVPTMFSAAEFTWSAGLTDPLRSVKEGLSHPLMIPQVVVLDPAATMETPLPLLRSTGLKAVDHAVEWGCGIDKSPLAEAVSAKALQLLYAGLPRLGGPDDDLAVRMDCQLGMWLSIYSSVTGGAVGASHAIGHVLGGLGVPHGHTTGVMLPAVLTWNVPTNATDQARMAAAIGCEGQSLARVIGDLASRLEVPRSLRSLGIRQDQLGEIAEKSLRERGLRTNPRPISSAADVSEILQLAW